MDKKAVLDKKFQNKQGIYEPPDYRDIFAAQNEAGMANVKKNMKTETFKLSTSPAKPVEAALKKTTKK